MIDTQTALEVISKISSDTLEEIIDIQEYKFYYQPDTERYVLQKQDNSDVFVFPEMFLWPRQQICKLAKVPHNFFEKNPILLKEQMAEVWFPTLKNPDLLIKYNLVGDSKIIRAILPSNYATITTSFILTEFLRIFSGPEFQMISLEGTDLDSLFTHFRIIDTTKYILAENRKFYLGYLAICSEIDNGADIILNTCLVDLENNLSILPIYSDNFYYESKYRGNFLTGAITECLDSIYSRMESDFNYLKSKIENIVSETYDEDKVRVFLKDLKDIKGMPIKFFRTLETDILENIGDYTNLFSLVLKISENSLSANSLKQRLNYETLCGKLLNLDLDK